MCHCTETRKTMRGNFWEKSDSVNSYRAEKLVVCAIHNMISALATFYKLKNCKTEVWLDNQGAVNVSKRRVRRIRPRSSCADILRNIKSHRNRIVGVIECIHVDGHIDKYFL